MGGFEYQVGAILANRYRLDRRLEGGGLSEVWGATQLQSGKRLAIKVLRLADDGQSQVRHWLTHEVRTASQSRHRHLVQVQDFLPLGDGAVALVMDWLDGESLSERLARMFVLPLHESARIGVPVASALEAVHGAGVVYRNLKPSNIFLVAAQGGGRDVKLLVSGLARPLTADAKPGDEDRLVGTPGYMAPEEYLSESQIDGRADIWSLGVILYRCLTGRAPFPYVKRDSKSLEDLVSRILAGNAVPLEEVAPELPPELSTLVRRMLSRDPAERPELREVGEALQPFTTPRDVAYLGTNAGGPEGFQSSEMTEDISRTLVKRAQMPRGSGEAQRPALWMGISGALAIALLVAGAVFFFASRLGTGSASWLVGGGAGLIAGLAFALAVSRPFSSRSDGAKGE